MPRKRSTICLSIWQPNLQLMQEAPSRDQIQKLFISREVPSSCVPTWWSNFLLMQVAPFDGQIHVTFIPWEVPHTCVSSQCMCVIWCPKLNNVHLKKSIGVSAKFEQKYMEHTNPSICATKLELKCKKDTIYWVNFEHLCQLILFESSHSPICPQQEERQ